MKNRIHVRVLFTTFVVGLVSSLVFVEAVFAEVGFTDVEPKGAEIATLREGVAIMDNNENPATLDNAANTDVKRGRAYPMQPPTIPHKIDGYQIDRFANQCLSCHARDRTAETQAPMISVTHFMDRDGNFLADVSPRRYFCSQCHVTQIERNPLLENTFKDVKELTSTTKPTHSTH